MEVQVLDHLEENQTRRRGSLAKILTAVFAVGFIVSVLATFSAFAAANLFKIQNAELSELSATAEGSIVSFDETGIISNVTFHKLNDSATYTITLKNTDDKSHVIENITDDNENPYVVYDYDTHAGEQINAGSDLVFVVTARYANAVTDVNERAQATNVKFLIEFTDIEEEVPLVPDTGANTAASGYLRFSVISLVISAVGLTIIGLVAVKKHQKAGRFIIVGLIAIAAVTTTAIVKAATIEINSFTIKTNFSLKDRLVVTWTDVNGNEHEEVVSYDEPANIEDQEKEGYTFTGWVDEDGNPVDPTQPITEDMKIHPTFRANKYSIKFHGNGATGGEMTDLTMTFDEAKALTANAFTWAGHEYTGWDTTANGSGTHYDDQAEVKNLATSDNAVIDLYAQWSVNPFHINYDSNGATSGEMATTNCEYDQTCTLRENAFKKTGYDFKGWTYDGTDYADKADVTNIIENGTITMSAKWEAHVYSIEYTGLTTEEATYLRAQGNPDTYTIEISSFTLIKPADRLDADDDTREHCVGWRDISVYEDITLPIADALGDKKYEAVWQTVALPEYSITYDYNGGTVATENPTKHNKEQSFTLNEPTKEGYTFTGWTGTTISGDTPVKPYTIPAPHQKGDLEYTAHYRANTYTVNFDINTDDTHVGGAMQPLVFNYDEEKALTANAFTRTGYTFAGWELDDTEYTDGQTVKNLTAEDGATITLKAQWTPTEYTVIFHANNENVENPDAMAAQVVTYDVETTLNPIAYTWWQHKLVEWTTNANGTGTKYADKATIKNLDANGGEVHLYAKWREIDAALDGRGSMTNKGINTKLKAITTANPDAKNFLHYPNGEPSDEIKASATDLSGTIDPIYAWVDGENIYWWSEDVKPRISTNNSIQYHYYGVGKSTTEGNVNNLEYMDLTGFDTTGIVGALCPFEYTNIKRVDISDWDLSNATDMSYFAYHSNLEDIIFPEHFDVQKVTSLNMAFSGAKLKKLDFRGWKTRDLKYLTNFIQSMPTITEVTFGGDFKTDNVTSMASMINANANLATINNINTLNTANVTSMRSMFDSDAAITSLDLSTFDTTALTDMAGMFKNMSGLTSLTLKGSFTAANVTNMEGTFYGVKNINTFDLSNLVSKPTNLKQTFAFTGGGAIETIDISNMDLSDVTTVEWTFFNANNGLKTIYTSSSVNPEVPVNNTATFQYDTGLVGGANTHTYEVGGISSGAGSRIDDPDNDKPGYFSYKNARYIRYHDNDSDDTNDEANYTLMPSHYMATTVENPYSLATQLAENKFERDGFKFMGWSKTVDGEVVYTDTATISEEASKAPLELYAVWKEKSAMFNMGTIANTQLKALNTDAATFTHYTAGTPDLEAINDELDIATSTSNFPIWAWADGDTIYWWSEAEKPSLNPDSLQMFNASNYVTISLADINTSTATNLTNFMSSNKNLRNIDFGDGDFTNVTTMNSAFSAIGNNYTTEKLTIDLSSVKTSNKLTGTSRLFAESYYIGKIIFSDKFETSGVTNFAEMFRGCGSLSEIVGVEDFDTTSAIYLNGMFWNNKITSLDLTGWNTSNVTTIQQIFRGCSALATLNVSNWDVRKVTNMQDAFPLPQVTTLDLSQWQNSVVTNMDTMFTGASKLTEIDLSGIDTSHIAGWGTSNSNIFNSTSKLETIYVSDKFIVNSDAYGWFFNDNKLEGGAGTKNNISNDGWYGTFARIDDPDNGKPGYFTPKNSIYIRYHDNDEDDANDEANYTLMPSYYVSTTVANTLRTNAFARHGYRFLGWAKSADGDVVYKDGATIDEEASKVPLELYAKWYRLDATLDTGANVNTILKNLATEPTAFEHYAAGTPNFDVIDGEQDIALSTSDVPVYAWYDTESTKIYWWSEAAKPKMNTDSSSFFAGMSSVTSIDVEGLDASNATNMSHMFRGTGLTDIDFSKLESQNVTDMSYMFYGIKKTNMLDVSKLDTSSVKNMASMFEGASFTSISFLDTSNPSASKFKTNEVTSMHYMFKDSTKLTSLDLSSFNTSNVKDFSGTFYGATGLKTLNLDGWDTGNATTMYIMFNNAPSLTRLDLSHFDTKNVTTMQQMFEGCFDLEYLNVSGWSNEKVGNMSYMFHKVGNYKNGVEIILTGFKTPAVTTMAYMFTRDVTELETLDLSSFDTSNVTSMSSMFGGGSQGNGTFYNAKIKTVYASDKFVTTKVDPESNVFNNTSVIVGGAGTTWSQKTAVFARIDDPDNGNPGYFTMKGARYIRYVANGGEGTMASHYLTNTGSLKANAFTNGSKTFIGWNTAADGSGDSYTDGQTMTELTESKTPLELYAQWEQTVQLVTFDDAYNAAGKTKVNNYYTMQDMDSSICNAVTTPVNTDNSDAMTTQLLDTRNNKVYDVGKLVDGRCWLLDNLSLDLTDADVQDNLTEDTTNASNTALGYLKNGGGGGADQYAMSGATIWTTSYNYSIPYIITAYSDTTGSGGYEAGKYGVYYTYCAATAGSYCYGGSPNYYNYGNASGDATEDICPKGWRLPTSGNSGETNAVSLAYNSDRTSVINALHTPFSGDVVYGYDNSSGQQKINLYQGTAAHFWSSTFGDSTYMRSFAIGETELIPSSSHYRTNATSVRCIAK